MIQRIVEPRIKNAEPAPELRVPGRFSVEEAYAYCERMARGHYENFPVASRFVPAELRKHVWAIYAFARSADDFADEARFAGRRAEALAFWEESLERAFYGEAEHPVFVALRDTVEARDLPINPLRDMLTAFNMDLRVNRYPTWSTVENYCAHSAHPVGRLMLYIFNYRDPALHRYADDFCTALQLTNFLQDVGVDVAKDRIYVPQEDLLHFGVPESAIYSRKATPAFRELMRFEVARARALFERGRPLIGKVGSELAFELALIFHGGSTILDKIEAVDYDVFARRPQLGTADKARMIARAATRKLPLFS